MPTKLKRYIDLILVMAVSIVIIVVVIWFVHF